MRDYAKVDSKPGKPGYRTSSSFQAKVFAAVKKIPSGKTLSYKQVAELISDVKAYRAVDNALSKNYDWNVSCHRVVCSDGKLEDSIRGRSKK